MSFKRSEEHTSELQSPCKLVCRLLLEKTTARKRQTLGIEHTTRLPDKCFWDRGAEATASADTSDASWSICRPVSFSIPCFFLKAAGPWGTTSFSRQRLLGT